MTGFLDEATAAQAAAMAIPDRVTTIARHLVAMLVPAIDQRPRHVRRRAYLRSSVSQIALAAKGGGA